MMASQDGGRKQARSLLGLVWRVYLNKLQKDPLLTKSLTAGVLNGLSNVVAQRTRGGHHRGDVSWDKVMKYVAFGLLWAGPSVHYWQNTLERLVPRRRGESRTAWALRKTVVDQLLYGPVANIVFLSFIGRVIEQKSFKDTIQKVKKEYAHVQMKGFAIWPIASLINQFFVPLSLRVLWLNSVSFGWSTFLMLRSKR